MCRTASRHPYISSPLPRLHYHSKKTLPGNPAISPPTKLSKTSTFSTLPDLCGRGSRFLSRTKNYSSRDMPLVRIARAKRLSVVPKRKMQIRTSLPADTDVRRGISRVYCRSLRRGSGVRRIWRRVPEGGLCMMSWGGLLKCEISIFPLTFPSSSELSLGLSKPPSVSDHLY